MEIGTALKAQEETADRHKSIVSNAGRNVSVRGKSAQYDSMKAKWIFKEACPLLVTTRSGDSERLELISDTVTQIEKLQAPLLVISSVGSHRSGISFLGNCLLGHSTVSGGFMCDNQDRHFHSGIWCFAKRLSVKDKKAKNKQIVLLYLDVEGLGSPASSGWYDAALLTFCYHISSTMLYHTTAAGTAETLVTELSALRDIIQDISPPESPSATLCQQAFLSHLYVVLRDCDDYLPQGRGTSSVVEEKIATYDSQVLPSLRQLFQQCRLVALPCPATPANSNNNVLCHRLPVSARSPSFVAALQRLKEMLFPSSTASFVDTLGACRRQSMHLWSGRTLMSAATDILRHVQMRKQVVSLQFYRQLEDQAATEIEASFVDLCRRATPSFLSIAQSFSLHRVRVQLTSLQERLASILLHYPLLERDFRVTFPWQQTRESFITSWLKEWESQCQQDVRAIISRVVSADLESTALKCTEYESWDRIRCQTLAEAYSARKFRGYWTVVSASLEYFLKLRSPALKKENVRYAEQDLLAATITAAGDEKARLSDLMGALWDRFELRCWRMLEEYRALHLRLILLTEVQGWSVPMKQKKDLYYQHMHEIVRKSTVKYLRTLRDLEERTLTVPQQCQSWIERNENHPQIVSYNLLRQEVSSCIQCSVG